MILFSRWNWTDRGSVSIMITLLRGLFRCVRSWERRRVRRVEEEEGERCGRKKGWEKRGREGTERGRRVLLLVYSS